MKVLPFAATGNLAMFRFQPPKRMKAEDSRGVEESGGQLLGAETRWVLAFR
jgi:hypothetical protein